MREMGKAMMGTGEASGEKRALSAAEAAISNPLIDDASMKGARGLLISITGGRDLTLYEVDEAATRIREEVDQDANIIVGATFDEGLEGIIRVSVVATGIDQAALTARPAPAPEVRLADITQKLRADQQRIVERNERLERLEPRPAMSYATPTGAQSPEAVEYAARAAVAAALAPVLAGEDVLVRSIQPKPSLFSEPTTSPGAELQGTAFIPPAPERAALRPARRMPGIEELPAQTQNELRIKRGEAPAPEHPEKRRMGLLQRLASVGLGSRREDVPEEAANQPAAQRPAPAKPAERTPARQLPRGPEPRQAEAVSDYAKRPTHQSLDQHGRQAPVHNSPDEDQLDIPAFLRRQAN
jgi:cell division protein FtsZ